MSELNRRKTLGFKSIMVSPETHARLAEMTNKSQIYNDVITKLLNTKSKSINRAEVLQGPQVGAQALATSWNPWIK